MMRLASPAFLRRAAVISSYGRGGYPRRGYSAHPSLPPHPGVGAELVSGDSHQQQPYRQGPHQQQPYGYNYGYGYGQPQQPGPVHGTVPVPSNYGHPQPQYGYGDPNTYFNGHSQPHGRAPGNAGFRPGESQLPRLADYRRKWRYAKQQPPHQAERFSVLSYKILADYLSQKNRHLYKQIPNYILDWNWRKDKLAFEFGLWNPDILCLQEIDKFTDLEQELARRGYSGTWKMRTGNAIDGCAIFWRTTRFQLRHEEDIEFNKLGLRDNVAQICVLESVIPRNPQTDSHSRSHPLEAKQIVVCNTHVLYNPRRGEIKLGQVRTLLDRAYTVSKMWNNAPVILCGGLNCIPKSPMYNFLSEQKLNLSGLTKPAISGQHTSADLQGLYTGPNISRSHPSFNTTNSKEGNIALPNGPNLQTETIKMVENSSPAGNGPVFADASSESRKTESSNCYGKTTPCSGSTNNLDKQELLSYLEGPGKVSYTSDADACANKAESEEGTPIDKSSEWCTGMIETESGEEPEVTGVPSAPATECGEILKSCSSEIVNSTHLLSSDESFGLKDSLEEFKGDSKKVSHTHRDLPCDVVPEEFTCASEGNRAQSDELLLVSEVNPDEKEKALESMLPGQDNCTANEPESCNSSASQSFTYALHQMSNMRLEGDSNTEATHLESQEAVHRSNGSVSDGCGNYCSTGVINKHSISSGDETTTNEVFCTDVNSDPTFFEELTGVNNPLLHEKDQLPDVNSDPTLFKELTSDPPSLQKMVTSNESYYFYDPYTWTPDDFRTATGKEDCTYVEHNLKLRSAYTDVEDFEGTKDANKEPLVTSIHGKFMGTLDYIWVSEDLQTVQVLDTFPKEILNKSNGFPTKKWGSDHISLVCELAFTK